MKYQKYLKEVACPDIKCFQPNVYIADKQEKKFKNIKY